MTKNEQATFAAPNLAAMSTISKDSMESMTKAFSGWLTNANRAQAEAIRFVNDRFQKDIQALSRFGTCKSPEDFTRLQGEIATSLMADYMEAGEKIFALFNDTGKEVLGEAAKAAKTRHTS